MPFLPLKPITDALLTVLNVPALLLIAPGGATDDPQQGIDFPFIAIEVHGGHSVGGLGTAPGAGAVQEINVRLHAFSRSDESYTWASVQNATAVALSLLVEPLIVAGYACGRWHPDVSSVPLREVELQGVKVKELVTQKYFYITEDNTEQLRAAAVAAFAQQWTP